MTKEEYSKKSEDKGLPFRCPILNYCSRRVGSIRLLSYSKHTTINELMANGEIPDDFEEKQISIQGELPVKMDGDTFKWYNNFCPEVSLFDDEHHLGMMPKVAWSQSEWDDFRNDPKHRILETKHYSECSEYSYYLHNLKNKSKIKKIRKPIPQKTKTLLQQEIKSKCPFCTNTDVDHFEIHHIDGDTENNSFDNLLMVCPTCHSKITKKDISLIDVVKKKLELKENNDTESIIASKLSNHDIEIIVSLLKILNVDVFQQDIFEHDSWYGYKQDAIHNILVFIENSRLLKNKVVNENLNSFLQIFLKRLDSFNSLCSISVYGRNDDWLRLMDEENQEKRRQVSIKLNKLSKNCYQALEEMIVFLKENNVRIE